MFLLEMVEIPTLKLVRNLTLFVSIQTISFSFIIHVHRFASALLMLKNLLINLQSNLIENLKLLNFKFYKQRPPVSFVLDNLESTTSYRLILFAVNAKGRSEPVIIDDISFKGVAKFTGELTVFVWDRFLFTFRKKNISFDFIASFSTHSSFLAHNF